MAFSDVKFIIFFAVVYAVLWLTRLCFSNKYNSVSKIVLLISSIAYIIISDWSCVIYLFLMSAVTYVCGRLIEKQESGKLPITIGIMISIFLLAIPKYSLQVSAAFSKLFSDGSISVEIMLPIGISFYTFSAIGYLIDIYRRKSKAYTSYLDYLLFLTFFPKLVCGPLVRSDNFFSQLESSETMVTLSNLEQGIQIFVFGVFKKLVLADRLGVFVNDVYNTPKAFSSFSILLAVISYSLQLYYDFSGYSDMAIGVGKILGFDLGKNFNLPYISKNLTEFWKRWHISLSSWLQEYLYYSLGGNRKGKARTYVNLFLTMLIGGIWHGAGVTFVIWGALHGAGLIVHKLFMSKRKKLGKKQGGSLIGNFASVLMTFIYVSVLWIFFRASSLKNAFEIISGMLSLRDGINQFYTWTFVSIIIIICYTAFSALHSKKKGESKISVYYPSLSLLSYKGMTIFLIFAGLTVYLAYFGNTAFIYGKF